MQLRTEHRISHPEQNNDLNKVNTLKVEIICFKNTLAIVFFMRCIPIIKVKTPSSTVFLKAFNMLDRYACHGEGTKKSISRHGN